MSLLKVFAFTLLLFIINSSSLFAQNKNYTYLASESDSLTTAKAASSEPFERDPLLCGIHDSLGVATVLSGVTTGILNPHLYGKGIHATFGYMTAALATATMAFGFWAHYGEIGPDFGWSSNNVHALLGITGGTLMAITPFLAPSGMHKVFGVLGVATMSVSIVWKIMF